MDSLSQFNEEFSKLTNSVNEIKKIADIQIKEFKDFANNKISDLEESIRKEIKKVEETLSVNNADKIDTKLSSIKNEATTKVIEYCKTQFEYLFKDAEDKIVISIRNFEVEKDRQQNNIQDHFKTFSEKLKSFEDNYNKNLQEFEERLNNLENKYDQKLHDIVNMEKENINVRLKDVMQEVVSSEEQIKRINQFDDKISELQNKYLILINQINNSLENGLYPKEIIERLAKLEGKLEQR